MTASRSNKVYVVMVADLFHYGHIEFLKRARAFGDYLIVGLLTDERVKEYKRIPIMTLEERVRVVEACSLVDEVMVHQRKQPPEWFQEHGIVARVHAIGTDTDREMKAGQSRRPGLPPRYEVPYERGISTTEIIERIRRRDVERV